MNELQKGYVAQYIDDWFATEIRKRAYMEDSEQAQLDDLRIVHMAVDSFVDRLIRMDSFTTSKVKDEMDCAIKALKELNLSLYQEILRSQGKEAND